MGRCPLAWQPLTDVHCGGPITPSQVWCADCCFRALSSRSLGPAAIGRDGNICHLQLYRFLLVQPDAGRVCRYGITLLRNSQGHACVGGDCCILGMCEWLLLLLHCLCSYVLRRILRRAVRYCTEVLQGKPGFFAGLVPTVVDILVSGVRLCVHLSLSLFLSLLSLALSLSCSLALSLSRSLARSLALSCVVCVCVCACACACACACTCTCACACVRFACVCCSIEMQTQVLFIVCDCEPGLCECNGDSVKSCIYTCKIIERNVSMGYRMLH